MDDKIEQLLNGQHYKKFQEAAYTEIIGHYDLTLLDIRVLLFLNDHGARNTAKDIVKMHYFTKSNVSKSIDTLLERGYLQKEYDDHDRRYIHLCIQPKAERLIRDAKQCQEEMFQTLFQGISQEEILVIRNVAQRITQNIVDAMEQRTEHLTERKEKKHAG